MLESGGGRADRGRPPHGGRLAPSDRARSVPGNRTPGRRQSCPRAGRDLVAGRDRALAVRAHHGPASSPPGRRVVRVATPSPPSGRFAYCEGALTVARTLEGGAPCPLAGPDPACGSRPRRPAAPLVTAPRRRPRRVFTRGRRLCAHGPVRHSPGVLRMFIGPILASSWRADPTCRTVRQTSSCGMGCHVQRFRLALVLTGDR